MFLLNVSFWSLDCTLPIEQQSTGLSGSSARLRSRYPIEPQVFTEQYQQQPGGHNLFRWSPSSAESKLQHRGEGNQRWAETSPLWGSFTVKPYIHWGALYIEHCLSWIFYVFRRLFLFCFSVKVKTTIYGSLLAPFPDRFVRMPSAHWILKVNLLLQPERYFWTIVKYQHDPLGLSWHHFYHFFCTCGKSKLLPKCM